MVVLPLLRLPHSLRMALLIRRACRVCAREGRVGEGVLCMKMKVRESRRGEGNICTVHQREEGRGGKGPAEGRGERGEGINGQMQAWTSGVRFSHLGTDGDGPDLSLKLRPEEAK